MNHEQKSKSLFLAATAMALAIAGCDSSAPLDAASASGAEEPAAVRAATEYEKDVLALKSGESNPDEILAGIETLRSRHGIAAVPIAPLFPADSPEKEYHALEKAAAANQYFVPRTKNFGVVPTPDVWISVPANATVEAWTTRTAGNQSVDPMLVGFYRTSGDGNSQAYKTRFIGFVDDHSGLDPYISWKNTTGAAKAIRFVAFAYDAGSTGGVTIKYRIVGNGTISASLPMLATRIPAGSPNTGGCTGPNSTRIGLQRLSGQISESVALAYNDATKRGGYLIAANALFTLDDVLPRSGASFLIGYVQANADGIYHGSTYKASQFDAYSCP